MRGRETKRELLRPITDADTKLRHKQDRQTSKLLLLNELYNNNVIICKNQKYSIKQFKQISGNYVIIK